MTRVSSGAQSPLGDDGVPAVLATGMTIGRYVILEEVGKGGMGVVYSAYDPQLQRRIALKLLRVEQVDAKGGSLTDSQQRLLREAQAMAKLSHPNVLSVFDAGIVDERVFIATEFVEGSTVRDWLRTTKPSLKAILDVFLAAGRGLAAAHARGIVHRDFKPHNVLIDGEGTVRVMDFGLARVEGGLERSSESAAQTQPSLPHASDAYVSAISDVLTHAGMIVGTPGYMAPEQFLGEQVGPAADQFSFCVSLYEALHGARPFQGKTIKEIGLAVCRGRITPPPQERRLPTWLRRAILRGLHPHADKRWPSMDDLLAELGRERHRWWVRGTAATAGLGLAILGGLAYGQYSEQRSLLCSGAEKQLEDVWNDSQRTALEHAFLAGKAGYAKDMWERVDRELANYANAWVAHHTQSCEATRIRGEQSEQALDLQMGCLADRKAELRMAVGMFSRADEAVIKNAVRITEGLTPVESCARVRPDGSADHLDPQARARLTEIRAKVAETRALYYAGKYGESVAKAEEAHGDAQAAGAAIEAAEALVRVGTAQVALGEPEKGRDSLLEGLWAADAARADEAGADARIQLAFVTGYYLGDIKAARLWTRHAEAAIARIGGDDRRQSKVLHCRATLELMEGRPQDALELWTQSRDAMQRAVGIGHHETAAPINAMGVTLQSLGRYVEAEAALQQAAQIWRDRLGPRYPDAGVALSNLGNVVMALGRYEDALSLHQEALDVLQAGLRPGHSHLTEANTYAAAAALRMGDLESARSYLEQALTGVDDPLAHDNPSIGGTLHQLGNLALLDGDSERARRLQERSIALISKAHTPDHPAVGAARLGLAQALLRLGQTDEARAAAQTGLEHLERVSGSDHPDAAEAHVVVAEVELAAGRYADALTQCRHALEIRNRVLPADHPDLAIARSCEGRSLLGLGRTADARAVLEDALAQLDQSMVSPGARGQARAALARSLPSTDHTRAERLARSARDELERAGPSMAAELELLATWQRHAGQP